ncbi:sensor histidine kinase [Cellulosimicrobium cellulans]|uniref:sensor histidine kinase n=1 Tax=Cellulosimicrobium cellulans TaxID=1710 RepID=UPI00130D7C4D|nr:histidine kinase [Cellulosimicrobium cellulans]
MVTRAGSTPSRPGPTSLRDRGEVLRLGAVAVVGAVSLAASVAQSPPTSAARWVLDGAVGVAALVALRWRRAFPVAVAAGVVLAAAVCASTVGAVVLAVVSLATWRRWAGIALVGALLVGSTVVDDVALGDGATQVGARAVLTAALYAALVGLGAYLGSRRELLRALRDRAHAAEREQAARVEQAQVAERTRIAREMHDVLAHRISLVAMHAGALAFRGDLPAAEREATAAVVRDNANLALVELRQVLGVLRAEPGSSTAPEPPQPTLDALPDLVRQARATGSPVEVAIPAGTAEALASLPPATSRNVYRVVQEGLTNARKHAPGAPVRLSVAGAPGGLLDVLLQNDPGTGAAGVPGSGTGLVGAAERVRLLGGRLDHGPDGAGGYRLHAVLPWPGPDDA